jgi:hypothetical protein
LDLRLRALGWSVGPVTWGSSFCRYIDESIHIISSANCKSTTIVGYLKNRTSMHSIPLPDVEI